MTDVKPIEMMNAKSLERSHFEATDWGRDLLRELDLIIAVGELDSMRTGATLYNTVLNSRIADIVAPLDRGLVHEHLGVFDVQEMRGEAAQAVGAMLIASPRGTMAVLRTHRTGGYDGIRAGIGYDAWMSNGTGSVDTNSGHKFLCPSERTSETSFRRLYGTVLSMIIHRQRSKAQNAIVEASVAAAGLTPGTKRKGDHYLNGRSWTSATIEKVVVDHYVGGGNAWQVRMTKPGHSKSFICEHSTVMRMFAIAPTMPEQWIDDGNAERLQSLHERREDTAKAMWPAMALSLGLDPEKTKYAELLEEGDALVRDVRDPSKDHAVIGSFGVRFRPGSDLADQTYWSEEPVLRRAA
jgi:hypothetical protein